jgi:geranylgeranyl pyrophosphate synthase
VPNGNALSQKQHSGLKLGEFDTYVDLHSQFEHAMLELVGAHSLIAQHAGPSSAVLAAAYHLGSGGQRVRGRLALSSGLALGLSKADALRIATTAELLHNASLVHDDLQDRDVQRHGQAAVWVKYGANVAICTGDLMLSAAYAGLCAFTLPTLLPALLGLVHERVTGAIEGQCADLNSATKLASDFETYKRIALAKSGALLSLPLELALLASGHRAWLECAREAAHAFAVGYQVVDDLADVERDSHSGALNVVFVLQRAGSGAKAHSLARHFGLEHLDRAITLANDLPLDSGALLTELSLKLRLLLAAKDD